MSLSPKSLAATFVAALLTLAAASRPAAAAPREIVIGHEILQEAGDSLPGNLERFVRRVEEVAGFGRNGLKGRAFVKPEEALAYIKKNRVAFAILPAHQYVEARTSLRLEVLGRAVGLDGTKLEYSTVTRLPKPFADVHLAPGLRVAALEIHDPAWLSLLTEGALDPRKRPMTLLEVPSSQAALDALLAKKADVAILQPRAWAAVAPRTESGGDLDWVVTSPKLPPSAFLAVGTFVSAADKKKMAGAVDKVCKTTGAEACARMGIMYIEAGRGETYDDLVSGYADRAPAVSGDLPRKR